MAIIQSSNLIFAVEKFGSRNIIKLRYPALFPAAFLMLYRVSMPIEITMVPGSMTQMLTFKPGQAHAIYDAEISATQLRDEGYPLQMAPGSSIVMNFNI
jgi:hypothetical protein